ncbi:hypothetical protein BKA62DRAFT_689791 [Auriculariales sp. MPI-PUGE-AT-0066]|nr:hypothetical protein BKA62DRAFT_689791 [Auriculariales sp. MPI-PUGE-AT-0066]
MSSSPTPPTPDGSSDYLETNVLHGHAEYAHCSASLDPSVGSKQEPTEPSMRFAFTPAGRLGHQSSRSASSGGVRDASYVSPFGRVVGLGRGPVHTIESVQATSSPSNHPAPSGISNYTRPLPSGSSILSDTARFAEPELVACAPSTQLDTAYRMSGAIVASHSNFTTTTPKPKSALDDDVIQLLWKKVKERERELARKDVELQEASEKVALLQRNLDIVQSEKSKLKSATKDALALSAQRLGELGAELEQFKRRGEAIFPIAAHVQDSLTELVPLRETIQLVLHEVEPLVGIGEGSLEHQVFQTKSIVQELRSSLENRQQIVDLLRDQIDSSKLEVAETRQKITLLEEMQARSHSFQQKHVEQLSDLIQRESALKGLLAKETAQLKVATIAIERAQADVHALQSRSEEKDDIALKQEHRIRQLDELVLAIKTELAVSSARNEDMNVRLSHQSELEHELVVCKQALCEAHAAREREHALLSESEASKTGFEQSLERLKIEFAGVEGQRLQLEKQVHDAHAERSCLQTRLAESHSLLQTEGKKRADLEQEVRVAQSELDGATLRISWLEGCLQDVQSRSEVTSRQHLEAASRCAVVEETALANSRRIQQLETQLAQALSKNEKYGQDAALLQYENNRHHEQRAALENQVEELHSQLKESHMKIGAGQSQSQNLQERFEECSKQLRLAQTELSSAREARFELLQSQTLRSEAFCSDIAGLKDNLNSTEAALQQSKLSAERAHVDSQKKDSTIAQLRQRDLQLEQELATIKCTFEELTRSHQLLQVDANFKEARWKQDLASQEERRALQSQAWQAEKARLEQQTQLLEQRTAELTASFAKAQSKSANDASRASLQQDQESIHELRTALSDAKQRLKAAQSDIQQLHMNAATIAERYDEKTLSSAEKALVSKIAKDSRSIYEQELVSKSNDLKKRENMIHELQERNQLLEEHIAQRVASKASNVLGLVTLDEEAQSDYNLFSKLTCHPQNLASTYEKDNQVTAAAEGDGQLYTPAHFAALNGPVTSPYTNVDVSPLPSSQEIPLRSNLKGRKRPVATAARLADNFSAKKPVSSSYQVSPVKS